MNKSGDIKSVKVKTPQQRRAMQRSLLTWYDARGRTLPWRVRPEDRAKGIMADPYAVWLSEIMLQQTTVPHAAPYWAAFLARFPTVSDLARADRDEVLAMWAGLGYYARARNLHKCAGVIAVEHDGVFPNTEAALLKLPGIGPYTAATIAAICFNEATNIVDGNVERVISRIFTVQTPLPKARGELRELAGTLASPKRPGDYGQALMDLGATICTPRSPQCGICPWQKQCAAFKAGTAADYPKKVKKAKLPIRYGAVFVLKAGDMVLLERRADKGLLGGMMGFPGTGWGEKPQNPLASAPHVRNWEKCTSEKFGGDIRHIFTHFDLRLSVYRAELSAPTEEGIWAPLSDIKTYALPTVMRKVLALAQK